MYNILGIDQNGKKEVLGFYLAESEGANFWLGVLNDLKERGVEDILIACVDGLKSFPAAINSVFPNAEGLCCIATYERLTIARIISNLLKILFFCNQSDQIWLCCIASYDGLKIKKMENISSLLFWYL